VTAHDPDLDLPGAHLPEAEVADDGDVPPQDTLLGIPLGALVQVEALRGLALLTVAIVLVVWPDPTDRVLGLLVGLAVLVYVAATFVQLVRDRSSRTFPTILAVSVGAGFAAALVTRPDESTRSVVQGLGLVMVIAGSVTLVQLLRRRQPAGWGASKVIGLMGGGALLVGFPDVLLQFGTAAVAAVLGATGLIQVFSPEQDIADSGPAGSLALVSWLRRRPVLAEDRRVLQEKVFLEGSTSPVRFARFCALMGFASVIAAIGVVVESTAVVIGAMLVAPLMTALMGVSLALTMGWPQRALRSSGIALTGVGLAIGIGMVVGAAAPRAIDPATNSEIVSRTSPTTLDLAIAVAAGAAGAYALSRRDVSDSLPGVAVAIALVPPLSVVGLTWQQGDWSAGNGALLLFLTNATAILLAGGVTFVLIGVAPLHRVSESQQRVKSAVVVLLSAAALVAVLLALNGVRATQAEVARAGVDEVVSDWTARHDEWRVVGTRTTSDGTTIVDLAGPGEPPELDQLLADLDEITRGDNEVRVTWVRQEQASVGGGG